MNRVLLHPIKICHINFMLQLVNDPEVTRYLPALIQDEKLMETWINNLRLEDHEYIISLNNGISIGECSLSVYDKIAEIGLMMLPQYWNHGYGSETVRMLMDIAVSLQIEKVTAATDQNNTAMIRILEKNGFSMQKIGWMLKLSEDGIGDLDSGQNVVVYEKALL